MSELNQASFASQTGDLRTFLATINPKSLEGEGYHPSVEPRDCVIVMNIHVLPSSVELIRYLIFIGFNPDSIIIIPKIYSTIPRAEERIAALGCTIVRTCPEIFTPGYYDKYALKGLQKGVREARATCFEMSARRCILVDDGGFLTDHWSSMQKECDPFDAISVQQTASGLYTHRSSAVRRINVASSAAKKYFESKIIVSGVMQKLSRLHMLSKPKNVAVIGLGRVGQAVAKGLRDGLHTLYTFDSKRDKEIPGVQPAASWQECVEKAEIIIGCSGRNFMHFEVSDLFELGFRKKFVSLSSRDVEFKSLILADGRLLSDYPLRDLRIQAERKLSHLVLNGGFPINFDRKIEWETIEDISLTRGLVLIGILQGLCVPLSHNRATIEKLALRIQQELVSKWLLNKKQSSSDYDVSSEQFKSSRWWHAESGGTNYQGTWRRTSDEVRLYLREE